jgi:hypothetical protein
MAIYQYCQEAKGHIQSYLEALRDYHGCIRMYPDVYPWMMDKNIWIVDKSMDIHG